MDLIKVTEITLFLLTFGIPLIIFILSRKKCDTFTNSIGVASVMINVSHCILFISCIKIMLIERVYSNRNSDNTNELLKFLFLFFVLSFVTLALGSVYLTEIMTCKSTCDIDILENITNYNCDEDNIYYLKINYLVITSLLYSIFIILLASGFYIY